SGKVTLFGQSKGDTRGMQKIRAEISISGNEGAQSDCARAPAAEKVARGIGERPRRSPGLREGAPHHVHHSREKKNLQNQGGQKRERHVAAGIAGLAAYDESALESAVAEDQQQQGFKPTLGRGHSEMERHAQVRSNEGNREAGHDEQ